MNASPSKLQAGIDHLLQNDVVLANVINQSSAPRIEPHANYYQELVESIVSQQLSVKAAAAILKRFLELFGDTFPSPAEILSKTVEEFRTAGLSRQKATYIQDLAVKVIEKTVVFDHLDTLSNEEVVEELTRIKGVGVWTVHMFLIFCMGRLDVLPVGDVGIKNGITQLYGLSEKPDTDEMYTIAQKNNWHPYESIASWYIWKSLDNEPKPSATPRGQ